MPLFYQHTINAESKMAVWHITENESFFLSVVPLSRSITHWHKRLQHLAGRYLLKELFPDFPYDLIEIADTRKPYLINEKYHFSISHCGDYAAVIVSKNERVGIDIELVNAKIERIQHKFLNGEELETIASCRFPLMGNNYFDWLTLLWSCKESVFKWDGKGGIDFKKDINLLGCQPEDEIINCNFLRQENTFLKINYKFFNGLCLAWIIQ